jgi:hypothetical protein
MVEILLDALDLLFRIALQRRGGLGMSNVTETLISLIGVARAPQRLYLRKNGCLRFEEGRMPIASRYFATVRRAISIESVDSAAAIC